MQSRTPAILPNPAISVRNLSKCYKLGTIGRHTLVDECQYLWHKLRGRDPRQHMGMIGYSATEARKVKAEQVGNQEFWALRDVSFDVQAGEAIGIIGRNGAGKSTLLKLLARITEPSAGEAVINGRIASLLEVGTGFHPELTGRENVYMNGTILGMKRREITARFDEIVAFAGMEGFIDTPVKRYSSGMYVRLAFAVAAHLEAEILLVDEVLAVGDMAFQRQCLDRMGDISKKGKTIFFVSHNMASIQSLCYEAIVLQDSRVAFKGQTSEAVRRYLQMASEDRTTPGSIFADRAIRHVRCLGYDGKPVSAGITGQPFSIEINYEVPRASLGIVVMLEIYSPMGDALLHMNTATSMHSPRILPSAGCVLCRFSRMPLAPGVYTISVTLKVGRKQVDHIPSAIRFQIEAGDFYGTGRLPNNKEAKVLVDHEWIIGGEGAARLA